MRIRPRSLSALLVLATIVAHVPCATAQTIINGASLSLRSSGSAAQENGSATGWTLSSDGYEGTYIVVSAPHAVTLTATASGAAGTSALPDLTLSVAGDSQSFSVAPGGNNSYSYTTPVLAPGTYLVRAQLDNSVAGLVSQPSVTLANLSVGGTGVSVSNSNTNTNATTAATTYANNYRRGAATVSLVFPNGSPVGQGQTANVQLVHNAFNFDLAVPGQSPFYQPPSSWLNYNTSTGAYTMPTAPGPGQSASTQYQYQHYLLQNFNGIVPENAGKWQNDEYTQGSVNLSALTAITQFAQANGLGMRMHNLLWATQQPAFVDSLFSTINSSSSTPSQVAAAKASLSNAITSRINYYVSGSMPNYQPGSASTGSSVRSTHYQELDVLNEPIHSTSPDSYQSVFGTGGLAQIYNQVATAAGAGTRLYTNEYNVLNNSSNPSTFASDPYANWYLNEVTALNAAGYGKVVTGVGSELYTTYSSSITPSLTSSGLAAALGNLAVAGDPVSLTEFGLSAATTATPTSATFAADLTTALTMMYGDPQATTFGFWGGLGGPVDYNAVTSLYDQNWNLTAVGTAYQNFMSAINTSLDVTTDSNGALNFTGTYGTYDLTLQGQQYQFSITPGNTQVVVTVVPEPAAIFIAATMAVLFIRSPLRRTRKSELSLEA